MFINNNLRLRIDNEFNTLWVGIDLQDKLCYSVNFLDNLTHVKELISYMIRRENTKFVVAYSLNKGVWNLGGDLEYFVSCIKNDNRKALKDYAYKCIDLLHSYNSNYDLDVFSTCVVQGNAFGGGFESALSGHYIVSEQSAKFSFPEIIFGTFPGMGAYSFLTKKVGYEKANQMINSNKTYSAQEVFDMGIINKVCEDGHGIATMSLLIRQGELNSYVNNPFLNVINKVSKEELLAVVNLWLERAFNLSEENLNRMVKLANYQKRKLDNEKRTVSLVDEEVRFREVNELINRAF